MSEKFYLLVLLWWVALMPWSIWIQWNVPWMSGMQLDRISELTLAFCFMCLNKVECNFILVTAHRLGPDQYLWPGEDVHVFLILKYAFTIPPIDFEGTKQNILDTSTATTALSHLGYIFALKGWKHLDDLTLWPVLMLACPLLTLSSVNCCSMDTWHDMVMNCLSPWRPIHTKSLSSGSIPEELQVWRQSDHVIGHHKLTLVWK